MQQLRQVIMMWFFNVCVVAMLYAGHASASDTLRIDPPHWFVTSHDYERSLCLVELLVEGDGLLSVRGESKNAKIVDDRPATNARYRYVTLRIDPGAPPHQLLLHISRTGGDTSIVYELRTPAQGARGLYPSDVIYLITPDRFANGDTTNDVVPSMRERAVDRSNPSARHGGDIAGIIKHYDHIRHLNVSAVWLNPVLENNQPVASYHGYAITDHYRIDPRFGTHQEYRALIDTLHRDSLRVVMDVVVNHVGNEHRLFRNPPDSSWFHWWPSYTNTNFKVRSVTDPAADPRVRDTLLRGWFDRMMPDIDQRNPHAARYLIQHVQWWIMEAGIDALRIDTYPYAYPEFMRTFNRELTTAFPSLTVFGEVWTESLTDQQSFLDSAHSDLRYCTDFATYAAITAIVSDDPAERLRGANALIASLQSDTSRRSRMHVAFVDNHDVMRIASRATTQESWLAAMSILFTLPRIPCVYYGTEFYFQSEDDHGRIRADMPGGFPGDQRSLLGASKDSLRYEEWMAHGLVRPASTWGRAITAKTTGAFALLPAPEGVVAYAHSDDDGALVTIVNTHEHEARTVSVEAYRRGPTSRVLRMDGKAMDAINFDLVVPPRTATIYVVWTITTER